MNHMPEGCRPACTPRFTRQAGAVFSLHPCLYAGAAGRRPKPTCNAHFRVTPASVHQMILVLERLGFIERTPRAPRSIRILIDPDTLPALHAAQAQTVKSPVQSHEIN